MNTFKHIRATLPAAIAAVFVFFCAQIVAAPMRGVSPEDEAKRRRAVHIVPASEGAVVELKTAKKKFFFGEPFCVKFIVKNTGKKPFSFETGGDWFSEIDWPMRFRIRAVNEAGERVPEQEIKHLAGGGRITGYALHAGETWTEELWPFDFLKITKPGKYTIRITHDFGWNDDVPELARYSFSGGTDVFSDKRWCSPIGALKVEFAMPDEAQAEAVLAEIAGKAKMLNEGIIIRAKDLSLPVFLAPMRKRAEQGELFFVKAIGEIPTREATLALLEIAEECRQPVANFAGAVLSYRVPVFENGEWIRDREKRERLATGAWDESLAPRARAIARRMLEQYSLPSQALPTRGGNAGWQQLEANMTEADFASRILSGIGAPEDLDALRGLLAKVFARDFPPRHGREVFFSSYPSPLQSLAKASDALYAKGARLDENIAGDAEKFLFFRFGAKEPRPANWLERINLWGLGAKYPIWEEAVKSVPVPIPAEYREFVQKSLNSEDAGVTERACDLVGKSKDKILRKEMLNVIRRSDNESLIRTAVLRANEAGGSRKELAEALAERIPNADFGQYAMHELRTMAVSSGADFVGGSTSREERVAMQNVWKKWIRDHASDLEAGKKFKPGDEKNLPKGLFVGEVKFRLKDGTLWPASPGNR